MFFENIPLDLDQRGREQLENILVDLQIMSAGIRSEQLEQEKYKRTLENNIIYIRQLLAQL